MPNNGEKPHPKKFGHSFSRQSHPPASASQTLHCHLLRRHLLPRARFSLRMSAQDVLHPPRQLTEGPQVRGQYRSRQSSSCRQRHTKKLHRTPSMLSFPAANALIQVSPAGTTQHASYVPQHVPSQHAAATAPSRPVSPYTMTPPSWEPFHPAPTLLKSHALATVLDHIFHSG